MTCSTKKSELDDAVRCDVDDEDPSLSPHPRTIIPLLEHTPSRFIYSKSYAHCILDLVRSPYLFSEGNS